MFYFFVCFFQKLKKLLKKLQKYEQRKGGNINLNLNINRWIKWIRIVIKSVSLQCSFPPLMKMDWFWNRVWWNQLNYKFKNRGRFRSSEVIREVQSLTLCSEKCIGLATKSWKCNDQKIFVVFAREERREWLVLFDVIENERMPMLFSIWMSRLSSQDWRIHSSCFDFWLTPKV